MSNLAAMFDNTPVTVARAFDDASAAELRGPIPAGPYPARWVSGGLDESRRGTPCFVGVFEITGGDHAGRRLRNPWYLSPAALPYSKRDLAGLGLTTYAQLESGAVPSGPVTLRVALRKSDDGSMFNEVKSVTPAHHEAKAATPTTPAAPAAEPVHASLPTVEPLDVADLPVGLCDSDLL